MITISLFILSGTILAVLMIAKRVEERRKTEVFLLKAISRGDARVRELHHQAVHFYSMGKEKIVFFVKKQLPMYSKISVIKAVNKFKEKTEHHIGNIRDSRLLKKSDGISEFFKNISDIEKGAGEINETYYEEGKVTIEPIIEAEELIESAFNVEPELVVTEVTPEVVKVLKPKKQHAPRTSHKKTAVVASPIIHITKTRRSRKKTAVSEVL